ncbi:hypothetical protein RUM43_009309 [Polyplax serrata]|uniref:MPN domain-containing protein n=1 Tax=Polyplax serrata TaxID=468196 RepID=A0AAN8NVX1_POLSC
MKIDYSSKPLHKEAEPEISTPSNESEVTSNSPVWKDNNINGNQMEGKPSEENSESQEKPSESQDDQSTETEVSCEEKKTESEILTVSVTSQTEPESQEVEPQYDEQVTAQKEQLPQTPLQQLQTQTIANYPVPQLEHKRRIVVKHSILGNKIPSHDPNVLVESCSFSSIGKIQPFLITVSTNAALVMDFHSHLTSSEVVGYLGGVWDVNSHTLSVTQAFPCKCRLGDYESSPNVESEIRKTMKANGVTLVGWYHSHPTAPPTPSIRDVEMQLDYELKMKGCNDSTYMPCIGFICSPYNLDNPTLESNIVSYWVVPPPENKIHEYGKPMMMTYTFVQDQSISREVLMELKSCADFYRPEKDFLKFTEPLKGSVTFLEKLRVSLTPKFPLNHQKSDSLWLYFKNLTEISPKPETDILQQIDEISSTPCVTPPPQQQPVPEKPKFNLPNIPASLSPLGFKSTQSNPSPNSMPYHKSHSRSKSSGKRPNSRENKHLASLSNYFVGSDLAALFGSNKFSGMGLDPATKSLLNLNSLSLGGMFLPPMAAAAAAAASYKPDPSVGLMKPPPPPSSYFPYNTNVRSSSGSRNSSGSSSSSSSSSPSSRSHSRSIPSTSRDMPPPNKVPKLDVHQMANFFIPTNLVLFTQSFPSCAKLSGVFLLLAKSAHCLKECDR